ncbi:hypothetical protein B14911_10892 [Bacillus sp. NRRL B-14911]|uniref:hypothetical protein n=1 Tax=Bacillus sp. NRRL B-14911 TaxID=313627 RepID=UPI00006B5951|nr:hypothetical protein [Bacillus sp. NRRL B-14911]EAR66236.1 hypothetical protein B14911_10892 [Bacillus sp. NRRL B-14911]
MWHLTSNYNKQENIGEFELKVIGESFAEYLNRKIKLFPIYLNLNCTQFYFRCQYQIEPYQDYESISVRLVINDILKIPFPKHVFTSNSCYIKQVEQALLSWIEEEYENYQKEWKSAAEVSF